ncbi:MAG: carbohydrate kinase [Saprospiraceae bacterium]|nr:carbohydrate kinase [Saprospiraceae bacterium]
MKNPVVICFGEVLWDLLPTGKIAGGAPMNVAYQTNNLGMRSRMISRLGSDELGQALRAFLQEKGVSTDLVQTDPEYPTGIVNVTLDEKGIPSYEIVQPAAWDHIELTNEMLDTVANADALVFGSLSCRSEHSKKTLLALLGKAPLRVFDVNLREPFYTQALLEVLLPKANIAKVNDIELDILANWYGMKGGESEQMAALLKKFGFDRIIVTRGEHGAACLSSAGYCSVPGISVKVQDTIGSGDAFLSGFLNQLFAGASDQDCLRFANALGALTATKAGGTPNISQEEIEQFLNGVQS